MADELIPVMAIPLEMQDDGLRTVEQDSIDDIAGGVYLVIATERGSRLEELDFGVEDPSFETAPLEAPDDEWVEQVGRWEPRAEISSTQEIEDLTASVVTRVRAR